MAGDAPPTPSSERERLWAVLDEVDILKAEGRGDEADRALVAATLRFPSEPDAARYAGWSAMDCQDWPEALRRWEVARRRFPAMMEAWLEAGLAHRAMGRPLQAEALLEEGVRRFPQWSAVHWHYAANAERRGDKAQAAARWRIFCANFPDDPAGPRELQRIEYERRIDGITRGRPAVQSAAPPNEDPGMAVSEKIAAMTPEQVLGAFESLGENCEFGFVQRHFGSEPLSLLRWGYVTLDILLSGLESGFAGVGDPEHTRVRANEAGEFLVSDARHFHSIHTHVYRDVVDEAVFLKEMCRRLRFFRRKLITDLEAGAKIFVYKRSAGYARGEQSALLTALRRYGDNRLLCVSPPDPQRPSGTLELLAEGLAAAHLPIVDRPLSEPLAYDGWLAIARQTLTVMA